jgi:hypothetical protein
LQRQVRENEEAHAREGGGRARGAGQFGESRLIPYSELEEATGRFDASRKIGQGGFGSVFFGRWNFTQVYFALVERCRLARWYLKTAWDSSC